MARDETIVGLYELVESDDYGRELLLDLLGSESSYQFYENFEKFLGYLIEKDLAKSGACARKILFNDILTALTGAIYLSLKLSMIHQSVKDRDIKLLKSFSSSTNEDEVEKISKGSGMFTSFASAKKQNLEMYAGFQASFSKKFDFRDDILKLIDLEPLSVFGKDEVIKPVKVLKKSKKTKSGNQNKKTKSVAKQKPKKMEKIKSIKKQKVKKIQSKKPMKKSGKPKKRK